MNKLQKATPDWTLNRKPTTMRQIKTFLTSKLKPPTHSRINFCNPQMFWIVLTSISTKWLSADTMRTVQASTIDQSYRYIQECFKSPLYSIKNFMSIKFYIFKCKFMSEFLCRPYTLILPPNTLSMRLVWLINHTIAVPPFNLHRKYNTKVFIPQIQ